MAALEAAVRGIQKDGLVWGSSKLVPVGYGIRKLQINLVVEDEKVSTSDLQEEIEGFEDYVQSSDIVSLLQDIKLINTNGFPAYHAEAVSGNFQIGEKGIVKYNACESMDTKSNMNQRAYGGEQTNVECAEYLYYGLI